MESFKWKQEDSSIPIGPAPKIATFLPGPTPPLRHACTAATCRYIVKYAVKICLYTHPICHVHYADAVDTVDQKLMLLRVSSQTKQCQHDVNVICMYATLVFAAFKQTLHSQALHVNAPSVHLRANSSRVCQSSCTSQELQLALLIRDVSKPFLSWG